MKFLKLFTDISKLAPVKQQLPESISYDQIEVVVAICHWSWCLYLCQLLFTDISKLAPIKQQLPESISYDQIKVVVAILKHRYGFTNNDVTKMVLLDFFVAYKLKTTNIFTWWISWWTSWSVVSINDVIDATGRVPKNVSATYPMSTSVVVKWWFGPKKLSMICFNKTPFECSQQLASLRYCWHGLRLVWDPS